LNDFRDPDGLFERFPGARARFFMAGDPPLHLIIKGLRRCQISLGAGKFLGQFQGKTAFPAPRAAGNKNDFLVHKSLSPQKGQRPLYDPCGPLWKRK